MKDTNLDEMNIKDETIRRIKEEKRYIKKITKACLKTACVTYCYFLYLSINSLGYLFLTCSTV
jgi:hypothetical protein